MAQKRHLWSFIFLLFLGTLGCGVVGAGTLGGFDAGDNGGRSVEAREAQPTPLGVVSFEAAPTPVPDDIIAQADAAELLLINLYERVNPSVVSLEVVVGEINGPTRPVPDNPDEDFGPFNPRGQGSGFVYDTAGHIVTNSHVVEGARAIFVTFYNGLELPAEVIGADPNSDLAIIKVDAPADLLLPVTWGDSDKVVVGQRAVAIGNPFGFQGSLTNGIVSGLSRELFSLNGQFRIPDIIQTDAAINPGNSGGPLLNSRGEVIGVNSAIVPRQAGFGERSFLGVGFAVPANLAQRVIPALIDQGYYDHPWFGIQINDVTAEIAQAMGLKEAKGALIVRALPGTPAADAGLRGGKTEFTTRNGFTTQIGGDVIIAIEGEEITSFGDLISFLSRKGVIGEPLTVTVIRDGKEVEIEVTPGARPRSDSFSRP